MKIEQRFNGVGWLGIAFLFVGPLVSAYGYWDLLATVAKNVQFGGYYNQSMLMPYALLIIGGIASLASLPLIIIGRDFEGFATGVDGAKSASRVKEPTF
ncbi:hypothetical protein [Brucella haematophila]|uniref:hypothetical protein n=1 Tax=Brucella haematophila TaxID=419474 RepID=UPI00110D8890|nr:hypothetical protein [Brucella haematophila]TMU86538.1 hypothetical protein FGI60_24825 [Brucella haematophila]